MTDTVFTLRTLDRPSLIGPSGPIALTDPRAFALLVLLALAGEEGAAEDVLLLRLTPGLTPARGRGALKELADLLRDRLGPSAIEWQSGVMRLASGLVGLDVTATGPHSGNAAGPRFLRGFALADSPEFGEWLDDARRRVAPIQPRAPQRRTVVAVGSGLVLAFALGVMAWSRPSAASRFPPGGTVVLADVDNATGDTVFDVGLTLAATVALEQSGHVGLLPRNRIREALSRAGVTAQDSVLSLDRAREAAAREGVRFVIAPRIASAASGFRVSAVLLDAFTDRLVKEAGALAETRAGVLPALDQVLREIRATLGETPRVSSERDGPLPLVTTPSLDALRSYALGARMWQNGEYELAQELWHRALDQDTGFAMAYSAVARAKALGHDRDSARYYFMAAFARAGRMTEWERLRLEESWASDRGDRDSSVKIARIIAEKFPTASTWFNYGTALMQADRCGEATRPFERALALDSASYISHVNLATCARRKGELKDAIGHYERAAAILPLSVEHGNPGYEFGGALAAAGLTDSAARQFDRMAAQPGLFDRALGQRGRAFLALQQGQTTEAAHRFKATIEIARQQGAQLSLMRGYLLLAMTHVLGGDTLAAGAPFDEMLELIRARPPVPAMLALAGWGLARAARARDAESLLLLLQQRSNGSDDDRAAEALLAGAIALARGEPERADRSLNAAPAFAQFQLTRLLVAEALENAGNPDSAAALRREVGKSTIFGTETQLEWIRFQRAASGRTP